MRYFGSSSSMMIGETLETMVTLQSLDIPDPYPQFQFYSDSFECADLSVVGVGVSVGSWDWGFLHLSQVSTLKEYFSGVTAELYIKTFDDMDALKTYRVKMYFPLNLPDKYASRVMKFSLRFSVLEEIEGS